MLFQEHTPYTFKKPRRLSAQNDPAENRRKAT